LVRLITRLAAVAALLLGAGAWTLSTPFKGFGQDVLLDIPLGEPTRNIAKRLEQAGVVRSRWLLLAARLYRPASKLQAGEYLFHDSASPLTIIDRLVRGDVHYYELSVPEGSNIFDIAHSAARLGIFTADEFLQAAYDTSPIHDLAPGAPTLEGYLFPSTYRLTRSSTPRGLCKLMTDQFRQTWKQLRPGARVLHESVTMASLVEKETGIPSERARVASVFRNRLNRSMPLQCDPTAIYAAMLEGRWRGKIHQSDLARPHAYNTYRKAGLPPGPIANPGRAALEAALHPEESNYLYFVARPGASREHHFSVELAEHERAVAKYRRGNQTVNEAKKTRGVSRRAAPRRG
jgi:UPF0755 protein